MILKTISEIARLKGCALNSAKQYIKLHGITAQGKTAGRYSYDITIPALASYIKDKRGKGRPRKDKEGGRPPCAPKPPQAAVLSATPRAGDTPATPPKNKTQAGQDAGYYFTQAETLAKRNGDGRLYFELGKQRAAEQRRDELNRAEVRKKEAVEKIAIEKAARLKLENDIKRNKYIELEKMGMIFSQVIKIHTSELCTLGESLSEILTAAMGLPDTNRKPEVKIILDKEIYKALAHIKTALIKWTSQNSANI